MLADELAHVRAGRLIRSTFRRLPTATIAIRVRCAVTDPVWRMLGRLLLSMRWDTLDRRSETSAPTRRRSTLPMHVHDRFALAASPAFGELRAPDSSPRQAPACPVLSGSSRELPLPAGRNRPCFASGAEASAARSGRLRRLLVRDWGSVGGARPRFGGRSL